MKNLLTLLTISLSTLPQFSFGYFGCAVSVIGGGGKKWYTVGSGAACKTRRRLTASGDYSYGDAIDQDGNILKIKKITNHPSYKSGTTPRESERKRFLRQLKGHGICPKVTTSIFDIAIIEVESKKPLKKVVLSNLDRKDEKPGTVGNTLYYQEVYGNWVPKPIKSSVIDNHKCANMLLDAFKSTGYDYKKMDPNIIEWLRCSQKLHTCAQTDEKQCMKHAGGLFMTQVGYERVVTGLATPIFQCDDASKAKNVPFVYTSIVSMKDFIDKHSSGHVWRRSCGKKKRKQTRAHDALVQDERGQRIPFSS